MNKTSQDKLEDNGDLTVAVLFSGGASGARYLFKEAEEREVNYEIAVGVTDSSKAPGIDVFNVKNVPVEVVRPDEQSVRDGDPGYFARVTRVIVRYDPDLVLLSGFMRIVKDPLLAKFSSRIVNVHPADLRIEENGERKYRGTDTVYRAIISGESEVRSTLHLVTPGVDEGPILVVSEPVSVNRKMVRCFERFDKARIEDYANLIQEWMKWACDGPAISRALALIGDGKVKLKDDRVAFEDETQLRRGYYDLKRGRVVFD